MTLFVTHYPQVTSLAQMYPSAKNVHMKTSIDLTPAPANPEGPRTTESAAAGLRYLHEVSTGPCDMKSGYGLAMAEQSGFPRAVMDEARVLRSVVRENFPVLVQQQQDGDSQRSLAAAHTLLQHLLLLRNSTLEPRAMQLYLHNLRERIPDRVAEEMRAWLRGVGAGAGRGDERAEEDREEAGEQAKSARV